jgi:hypothetical protein
MPNKMFNSYAKFTSKQTNSGASALIGELRAERDHLALQVNALKTMKTHDDEAAARLRAENADLASLPIGRS